MTRKQLAEELLSYDIIKKNLRENYWVSGSSTYVYPCMIWEREIVFQLTCYEDIFKDFILEVVDKYSDVIKCGYFWESDGSCPCTLTFVFKEDFVNSLQKEN